MQKLKSIHLRSFQKLKNHRICAYAHPICMNLLNLTTMYFISIGN
jgi:hypothetical protein